MAVKMTWDTLIIIFLVLGALAGIVYIIISKMKSRPQKKKHEQVEQDDDIDKYISELKKKGLSKEKITESVLARLNSKKVVEPKKKPLVKLSPYHELKLYSFISRAITQDYSTQQIRNMLLDKGWPQDIVDQNIRKLR